jgi:hypothetical protein
MRNPRRLLRFVTVALAVALIPSLSWAGGTPKQLWGAVRYSDGSVPLGGASEVSGLAWIVPRPGETIPVSAWYDPGDNECYASAELGNLPTPWAVGETAAVELTGDGTHHGGVSETNTLYVVLDASGSQNWGIFYLPVELTSFTAEGKPGCAVIRWSTATETDNLGFWLWRSTESDGEYAKVNEALIKGAGTSTQPRSYVYADEGLAAGTYWYKLQDVAANGETRFHGPVEVTVLPVSWRLTAVTPNPVSGKALIRFELPQAALVKLSTYDVRGSLVTVVAEETLEAGSHARAWVPEAASSGVYLCTLHAAGASDTRRIVLLR